MRSGQLKYQIQLLQKETIRELNGSTSENWIVYTTVRAGLAYKSGNKMIQDYQIFNSSTVDLTMRFDKNINEQMRIFYGNQVYKILFINRNPFDNSLSITCELIVGLQYTPIEVNDYCLDYADDYWL
jgi:SPP1 family predicted phage head-tail adaptor